MLPEQSKITATFWCLGTSPRTATRGAGILGASHSVTRSDDGGASGAATTMRCPRNQVTRSSTRPPSRRSAARVPSVSIASGSICHADSRDGWPLCNTSSGRRVRGADPSSVAIGSGAPRIDSANQAAASPAGTPGRGVSVTAFIGRSSAAARNTGIVRGSRSTVPKTCSSDSGSPGSVRLSSRWMTCCRASRP